MREDEQPYIILIDAEKPYRRIVAQALTPLECRLVEADELAEGRELAKANPPDLILLAEESGLTCGEACAELRSEPSLQQTPIILLLKNRQVRARAVNFADGAVDYLVKPFLTSELLFRVRMHLQLQEGHRRMNAYSTELQRQEKAEFIRTFAMGLGHNFNNLLTAALGFLSLAQEQATSDDVLGSLRNTELSLLRMCRLAKQLLAFTGELDSQKRAVPVKQILKNVVNLFDHVALKSRIVLICDFGRLGGAVVRCDEFQLVQAILEILHNAREAVESRSERIFLRARPEDDWAVIEVLDMGTGMPKHILEQARNPFFTTKPNEIGTGLGLSMADGVVRKLGGRINIESEEGVGTRVSLYLPLAAAEVQAGVALGAEFRHGVSVLLAVDADETRQAIQAVLTAAQFYVEVVDSLAALRSILDSPNRHHDVLIVDLLKGFVFGEDLIAGLREQTALPMVHLVSTQREESKPRADVQILRKPFTADELLDALRRFPQLVRD